jgi:Galactose oxidase, central domain
MRTNKSGLMAVVGLSIGLWACGSPLTSTGSGSGVIASISSITPTSAAEGSSDLQLTMTGQFTHPDGQYRWIVLWSSNTGLPITSISRTQITAVIPATLLVTPVTAPVRVQLWYKADDGPRAVSNAVTFSVIPTGASSGFVPTGNLSTARSGHTATLLTTGNVLIAGGGTASAELFHPGTGSFTPAGSMSTARSGASATLLRNGTVLVAGGTGGNGVSTATAEAYNPATNLFAATASMMTPRSGATATLLQNGKVLIAGGVDNNDTILPSAELYDPATGSFTATAGNMTSGRWLHTATLLANGKVLVTGGRINFSSSFNTATAELFDPFTNTFAATGSMATGRNFHTATLLADGKVLVLGGNPSLFSVSTGELYDPAFGSFKSAGNMSTPRAFHTGTLLPSGTVLVTGGLKWFSGPDAPESTVLSSAEIFDVNAIKFSLTGSLGSPRVGHTATLLMDGRVLIAGGSDGNRAMLDSAELFR